MLTKTLAEYGPPVVALVMPFLLLVWPWSPSPLRSILPRMLLICVTGWILFAGIAWCHRSAWQSEFALQGNVPDWDPAFGMAVYFVGGGILTFLGSLPSMLVRGIIDAVRRNRSNRNEAEQGVTRRSA